MAASRSSFGNGGDRAKSGQASGRAGRCLGTRRGGSGNCRCQPHGSGSLGSDYRRREDSAGHTRGPSSLALTALSFSVGTMQGDTLPRNKHVRSSKSYAENTIDRLMSGVRDGRRIQTMLGRVSREIFAHARQFRADPVCKEPAVCVSFPSVHGAGHESCGDDGWC